jgi:hypothetical protein
VRSSPLPGDVNCFQYDRHTREPEKDETMSYSRVDTSDGNEIHPLLGTPKMSRLLNGREGDCQVQWPKEIQSQDESIH